MLSPQGSYGLTTQAVGRMFLARLPIAERQAENGSDVIEIA
jgi:hypothetical protein